MKIITDKISRDEPCHGLLEVDRSVQGEMHRMQSVFVVRGDSIAAYETDLGPSSLFGERQAIFAMGDESVAFVMDWAERDRYDDTGRKLREELRESSTLIKDFIAEKEQNWERINNRSVFGPGINKQRNGYSKKAAWEA